MANGDHRIRVSFSRAVSLSAIISLAPEPGALKGEELVHSGADARSRSCREADSGGGTLEPKA
jgi:hypothetical protein